LLFDRLAHNVVVPLRDDGAEKGYRDSSKAPVSTPYVPKLVKQETQNAEPDELAI